jgi:signal transduction histidine kinase
VKLFSRITSWLNRHPTVTDGLVSGLLAGLAFLDLYVNWGTQSQVPLALAITIVLVLILPFTLRRRYPLLVMSIMAVALILYRSLNLPESSFNIYALLLAFFSAGAYGRKALRDWLRMAVAVIVVGFLTYSVFFVGSAVSVPVQTVLFQISVILLNIFLFGAAWWVGDVFRIRREHELALQERTVQLENERDENARRAVLDERVRIARELHDVVAHHVSVLGIQAGAARRSLKQQPEKASEALSSIEESSRLAVRELQQLLGFLRQQNQGDEIAPQPGLKQLDMLIENMREAGLPVVVNIKGEQKDLPPGIDLSAYRIIQEALTNTLKHAGTASAEVTITYQTDSISLEIVDNGRGTGLTGRNENQGRGIIGMRERVHLYGGEFQAGKVAGNGFLIKARLPIGGRIYEH